MPSAARSPSQSAGGARRPRNRRRLIARAAALAFSERGYHGVSMEEIAAGVGISAPALYRHYPGKYSLFLESALALVQDLLDATADGVLPEAAAPQLRLEQLVNAVIAVTQANRRTGSIYRHEARYLDAADHALLWTRFDELTRRILTPLAAVRPEIDERRARFLAVGAFGMIASITAHHTALAPRKCADLLRSSALTVLYAQLPPDAAVDRPPTRAGSGQDLPAPPALSRRELLLAQAVTLFYRKGYREATIEEVGAAAGITASAVYRHFPGKSALLLQACRRAADRLAAVTAASLVPAAAPGEALAALTAAYVRHTFAHHELMSVYFTDSLHLSAEEQDELRRLQRRHIGIWVELLTELRPELSPAEVRFLVHGALNMTADLGRFTRFDESPATREMTTRLILQALGVPG